MTTVQNDIYSIGGTSVVGGPITASICTRIAVGLFCRLLRHVRGHFPTDVVCSDTSSFLTAFSALLGLRAPPSLSNAFVCAEPSSSSNAAFDVSTLSFSASGFDTSFSKLSVAGAIFALCSSILNAATNSGPTIHVHAHVRQRKRSYHRMGYCYGPAQRSATQGTRSKVDSLGERLRSQLLLLLVILVRTRVHLLTNCSIHLPKVSATVLRTNASTVSKVADSNFFFSGPGGSLCPDGMRTAAPATGIAACRRDMCSLGDGTSGHR